MKKVSKNQTIKFSLLSLILIPIFMFIDVINLTRNEPYTVTTSVLPLKENEDLKPTIKSDKYIISEEKLYIYTKTDTDNNKILSNITVANGSISLKDNILYVSNKYNFEGNLGDINSDGQVTKEDAMLIFQYKSGETDLTDAQIKVADVDNDGELTLSDALTITKYIQMLESEEVVIEYKIVNISSNKYDLTNKKITVENEFNINYINVTNGEKEYKNNQLLIKYDDELLDTYDIEIKAINSTTTKKTTTTKNNLTTTNSTNAIVNNPKTSDLSITVILGLFVATTIILIMLKKKISKIK